LQNEKRNQQDRKKLLDELEFVWSVDIADKNEDTDSDTKSEASAGNVGLPNEAQEETEPAEGHVRSRFECPSPANIKRPRTCLAESGKIMAARKNRRVAATRSCPSSVKTNDGRDEEDPQPALVTSSVRIAGSDPVQEIVVEEEVTPDDIPAGWTRTKLEPN
jgi:hypothetical protein